MEVKKSPAFLLAKARVGTVFARQGGRVDDLTSVSLCAGGEVTTRFVRVNSKTGGRVVRVSVQQ